jgi:hypothetical protein
MMNDNQTSDAQFEHLQRHLDELAVRATRAVAELRVQSQLILDDVAEWKQHLDLSRVDAELARMDARDDLRRARAAWDEQQVRITRRFDAAREDSAAALRSLRAALVDALRDLGETLDFTAHAP